MSIISRGFSGRRSAEDVKLPTGQYLTTDFPVLSAGPTPHIALDGPDVDLSKYRTVSVWCKRFSVNFGAAPLTPDHTLSRKEPEFSI